MRNRDNTAFPRLPAYGPSGLTKREAAAIAIMQALLTDYERTQMYLGTSITENRTIAELVAVDALSAVDALFDELEKDDDQD